MRKIPEDIRKAITYCAKHAKKSYYYGSKIEEWLDELGLSEDDTVRDMLQDSVTRAGNDPKEFIKFIKEYKSGKGVD